MEYYDDLFTYGVLVGEIVDERCKIVDAVIYFHNIILLKKDSNLKKKLLDATYEILLSKPIGFTRAYHTILKGFI